MRGSGLTTFCFLLTVGSCGCPPKRCLNSADCEQGSACVEGACIPIGGVEDSSTADAGDQDAGGNNCLDMDLDGHFGTEDCNRGDDCDDTSPESNPDLAERCGDGLDNDCDGDVDEPDCECIRGERIVCYEGPVGTRGIGQCRAGATTCRTSGEVDPCTGQIMPGDETCDGTDEDCDGNVDEGVRNQCGICGTAPIEEPTEMCGNESDDDCDGMTDESCDCDYRCQCPGGTSCECQPPTNQPCYEGPFGTDGVGVCVGGRRDCIAGAESATWGECAGQVIPTEECAGDEVNDIDEDCDGLVDEGCRDADEDGSPFPEDCDDNDATVHPNADETCNGRDDNCNGVPDEGVTNACGGCGDVAGSEECDNGTDDDCDGSVDEGCSCSLGQEQDCYHGPPGTQDVGTCSSGTQQCEGSAEFAAWGPCVGDRLPGVESCDGTDQDCDGEVDERYAIGSNACGFCDGTEECDGDDQDCDGLVDEGVSNACGECGPEPVEACDGMDNDCDAIVDEGTVNACGLCVPEPCFTEEYPTPAECETDGRTCDDVVEHPDFPGSVTLGESTLDFDYIYIAVTAQHQVAQLDTMTGNKNWQVMSHGRYPSRTAVASDGSVWVTNRAHTNSTPSNVEHSNVVHLRAEDGSLICRAPVLNIARSVAIDANGDVWAGSFNGGDLYHISGSSVDETTTPPTCEVLNVINTGQAIYGLTADPEGYIWTASSPTVRVSIADYSMMTIANPSHYGVAPDGANRIWFGGWRGSGNVHSLNRTDFTVVDTGVGQITAVTVHPEGSVWGSSYGTNEIVGFNPDGSERCRAGIPSGNNPHGVAVDRMGRIWMPSRFNSGNVEVYDTACNHLETYEVDAGRELYSYSDMTGHLLRTFIAPEGNWLQVFDSGYDSPYWDELTWVSDEPDGTEIEFYLRAADTPGGLDMGVVCGPFTEMPADLSMCPPDFHGHRYVRVEARLTGSTTERPILHSVAVTWAY